MALDKIVDSTQLDSDLTSVANAIRAKSGGSAQLAFPAGFVSEIWNIPSGGSMDVDDYLVKNWPTGNIVIDQAAVIGDYSFHGNQEITGAAGSSVQEIRQYAFAECKALTGIDFPNLTKMGPATGTSQSIAGSFFFKCFYLDGVTHLPSLQYVYGSSSFAYAGYRESGTPLKTGIIVFPSIIVLGNKAFEQARLDAIDLGPNYNKVWNDTFYRTEVNKVILRSPTVVPAATRDAVRGITTLYAPQAILSLYATETNWSTDAAGRTLLPIEGSYYETHYADGTLITQGGSA